MLVVENLVAQIHAAPPRLVYAFAGAGSLALWWLHSIAGSSRTLLEATDCYAPRALAEYLGAPPAQAVSQTTASTLADRAYARAAVLSDGTWPCFGIGCTAAIATDRTRRGADRCAIAVSGADGSAHYHLSISRARPRAAQEELIARLVLIAIARACAIEPQLALELRSDEQLAEQHD